MSWIEQKKDGIYLRLLVVPKSSKSKIVGFHDNCLRVTLTAPPVDGKANSALLKYFSKTLGINQSDLEIISGLAGRRKRLLIKGWVTKQIADKLHELGIEGARSN